VSIPSKIWCTNVVPELLELDVLAVIIKGCEAVDEDLTEWVAENIGRLASVETDRCYESSTNNRRQKHA